MNQFPCLIRTSTTGGEIRFALGDPLVDSYLAFVAGRSRPNTLRAVSHDLKTFFTIIDKDPVDVVAASGSATASRAWRHARSPAGCRRSRASTRISWREATRR
jgi:hypothetical protein